MYIILTLRLSYKKKQKHYIQYNQIVIYKQFIFFSLTFLDATSTDRILLEKEKKSTVESERMKKREREKNRIELHTETVWQFQIFSFSLSYIFGSPYIYMNTFV